jgi:hypothetical protein
MNEEDAQEMPAALQSVQGGSFILFRLQHFKSSSFSVRNPIPTKTSNR